MVIKVDDFVPVYEFTRVHLLSREEINTMLINYICSTLIN